MFLSLSSDITVVVPPETKLKLSHSVSWFSGVIWATSHILYSSLRVSWVHLLFSFLFCRRTWPAGIIGSAIFTRLAQAQPQSKFSDRFTEGSTPTLSHRHPDKDALGKTMWKRYIPMILDNSDKYTDQKVSWLECFESPHQNKYYRLKLLYNLSPITSMPGYFLQIRLHWLMLHNSTETVQRLKVDLGVKYLRHNHSPEIHHVIKLSEVSATFIMTQQKQCE